MRRHGWRVAVGVAAVLAALSGFDARGFRRRARLQRDVVALTERNRQLSTENSALSHEIQALRTDPAALERAAREELGFVKPGEIVLNLE